MENKEILCPMCKKHMAIILREKAKAIIKDEEVEFNETVYFCSTLGEDDEDAYFIPPKVMNENLLNAKNAYRKMKGLLTSYEMAEYDDCLDPYYIEADADKN